MTPSVSEYPISRVAFLLATDSGIVPASVAPGHTGTATRDCVAVEPDGTRRFAMACPAGTAPGRVGAAARLGEYAGLCRMPVAAARPTTGQDRQAAALEPLLGERSVGLHAVAAEAFALAFDGYRADQVTGLASRVRRVWMSAKVAGCLRSTGFARPALLGGSHARFEAEAWRLSEQRGERSNRGEDAVFAVAVLLARRPGGGA
ncbi:hypothetical protein [Streptomyces sp. NPDC004284]|uniref:hypothetical protein n=1 Tax=Streptomyces sp. NPDC004284 TaxID=3364695 RepID=UPI0036B008F1